MNTDVLRVAFQEDVQLAGPPPTDVYESVVARRRKSDQRRRASLAAGVIVALVAIAVPVGISLVGPRDTDVAGPPTFPDANVLEAPTRGSLAGDTDFVEGVRQLSWAVPGVSSDPLVPDPPVETRSVVFAGDVPGGRWALVVGTNTAIPTGDAADPEVQTDAGALSDIAAVWYVGPHGAAPEDMQPATFPRGLPTNLPVSLYDGSTGSLVVVAARGDLVEVSDRPDVAADASVTRIYTDTETADGVAVLALEPNLFASQGMPAVQYRVTREGVVVAEQVPDSSGVVQGPTPAALPLQYQRSPGENGSGSGDMAQFMAAQMLGQYGLHADEVELRVAYVGTLPGTGGEPAELIVVTVTLPSGAVAIRADWTQQVPGPQDSDELRAFQGGSCADEVSPAGVPVAERTLALRCDVYSGNEDAATESTLVVLAPVGGSGTYAEATGGPATTRVDLDSTGVGMVGFPSDATTVVIHAGDGTLLDEVPIFEP